MIPSTIGNESFNPSAHLSTKLGTKIDNNANPETAVKQPTTTIKPTKK